jgi:hypothetical protein
LDQGPEAQAWYSQPQECPEPSGQCLASFPREKQQSTAPSITLPAFNLWLRCLPALGEAQGFFAPLPHMLAASLRATLCVPTEEGDIYFYSRVMEA